jgi:hypothetical protein
MLRAGSVVVLWLLSVSASAALPASRRTPAKFCDAQTTSVRKLIRQARAIGGPLAKRFRHGIRPPAQSKGLQRDAGSAPRDEDQAIQNDTSATEGAADLEFELQPIGSSLDTTAAPIRTHVLSPRAPRGPPQSA